MKLLIFLASTAVILSAHPVSKIATKVFKATAPTSISSHTINTMNRAAAIAIKENPTPIMQKLKLRSKTYGYTYAIKDQDNNIKYGLGEPSRRLKQLQTGNAQQLDIVYSNKFDTVRQSKAAESLAHKINGENRLRGEWFSK